MRAIWRAKPRGGSATEPLEGGESCRRIPPGANKLIYLRRDLKAGAMFCELFGEQNREAGLRPSRWKAVRVVDESLREHTRR